MDNDEKLPKHSTRPRCCDFCQQRGYLGRNLYPVFVRSEEQGELTLIESTRWNRLNELLPIVESIRLTGGIVRAFWVHEECILQLMNGPGAREVWKAETLGWRDR